MTLEETVEYFRDMVEGCGAYELCPCFKDDMEMTKIALSALEKQTPKKPIPAVQSGFFWCPACSKAIKMRIEGSKINISYCPFCGQALDWRENK